MPEFTTVSVKEAQLRTISGRRGKYLSEFADYLMQLPQGQAGRLRIGESENPLTIRRRLAVAAQTLGMNLIIKRSGRDVYFWRENGGQEQPRVKRRYTRGSRRGSPGSMLPPTTGFSAPEPGEETTQLDQAFVEID